MKRRSTALVVLAVLAVACQGRHDSGAQQGGPRPEAVKSAADDVKASTYKDPIPPKTSPAPQGTPRTAVNPREVTPSGAMRDEMVPGLKFHVPAEWVKKPATTPMRLVEFTLPGPGGDAELVGYRFAGGGGDTQSNIHRWRTQFTKADGTPFAEGDGKVQAMVRGPLTLTLVDLAGTYVAQVTPGASERYSDPNYRMLAVIVEGQGDPYFFKAVGPAATLAVWEQLFGDFAASIAIDSPP